MYSDYIESESTNPNQLSKLSINKSNYYSNNQKPLMSPLVKMSPLIIQNTSMKYNQGLNMISSQCGKDKWSTLPKHFNPFDFSLPVNFDKIPKIQFEGSQSKTNEENNNFQQNNFFKSGFLQNDKFKIGKINSFLFSDFRNSSNKKDKETDKENDNFISSNKTINYISLSLKNENNNEFKNNKTIDFENKKKRKKIKSRNKTNNVKSEKEKEKMKIEKAKLYKEKKKLKKLFQSKEDNDIITENGVEYIQFLRKKRKLKAESLKRTSKKEKKETKKKKPVSKKLDKTKINVQLNQIEINGFSLVKFPAVNNIPLEDQSVNLYVRMLVEENYFEIVNKYISDIPPINEEKFNKQTAINKFKKIKHILNNLYLIEENKNENNPVNMIKNYYHQIKDTLLLIQKNFVGKKKSICNIKLCETLEKLIKSCNDLTNTLTDYKKIGVHYKNDNNNKNNKNLSKLFLKDRKKNHYKVYICEICNKALSNGQGLGGHMSRNHPNQSEKYKEKLSIRNKRLKSRKRLITIKKMLFSKYNLNYDNFVKNKEKVKIRKFLLSHKDEYRRMKNHFIAQSKLLNSK